MTSLTRSATLALAVTASMLAGCASNPATSGRSAAQTPEQVVAERAQQRWQALIGGEWEKAYGFLTPGYREANDLEAYRANFAGRNLKWLSSDIARVDCDAPQRCVAVVNVTYELEGGMPGLSKVVNTQAVDETWLLVRSGWYNLPRR